MSSKGSTSAASAWVERRQDARQMLHLAASGVGNDGLLRIPVIVVNLSRTGIMVQLPESVELPPELTFLFGHRYEPCHLVWRKGDLAGFNFVDLPG